MPLIFRTQYDFQFGTLSAPISASDTSITSAEFVDMGTVSGGSGYIPITILDPASRLYEVVWIGTHAASSTTVTSVARGQEGTSPKAWPAGAQWILAPTIRDSVASYSTSTTLPSDAHLGQRVALGDKGEVWEKTYQQGFLGLARANREDMGRHIDGTTSASNAMAMMIKAVTHTGSTNASGIVSVPLPNGGFPNKIVAACVTRSNDPVWFNPVISSGTTSKTAVGVLCQTSSSATLNSTSVTVCVIAVGY